MCRNLVHNVGQVLATRTGTNCIMKHEAEERIINTAAVNTRDEV